MYLRGAIPGNPNGFFYFNGGELHHAVYGDQKGKEAAMKMMQIEEPTFNFRPPPARKIPRGINLELTALILEAMRRKTRPRLEAKLRIK